MCSNRSINSPGCEPAQEIGLLTAVVAAAAAGEPMLAVAA